MWCSVHDTVPASLLLWLHHRYSPEQSYQVIIMLGDRHTYTHNGITLARQDAVEFSMLKTAGKMFVLLYIAHKLADGILLQRTVTLFKLICVAGMVLE